MMVTARHALIAAAMLALFASHAFAQGKEIDNDKPPTGISGGGGGVTTPIAGTPRNAQQILSQLNSLPANQAAALLNSLTPAQAGPLLNNLSPQRAAALLGQVTNPGALLGAMNPNSMMTMLNGMSNQAAGQLLGSLGPQSLANVLNGMDPRRAAAMLAGLPASTVQSALNRLNASVRNSIMGALPADSPLRAALGGLGLGGAGAGAGQLFAGQDEKFRQTEVMCDTRAMMGSCPKEPAMMKTTEKRSLIKEYTPWLYAYARDLRDRNKPYTGPYYRGTPGDPTQTFGLVCPPGQRCPASCATQIKFPGTLSTPEDQAKAVRMQLDNCSNQYILNSALYPYQKENPTLLSGEDPNDGSARISLETSCQPLKTALDTRNEYFASDYLKAAWIKLMQDPAHRKNPRAPAEPHLPTGVTLENPLPPPSPFPDVRLSSIGAVEYEEINDPTHPYSPRWDYEFNERDHYSPMTASYSGDPANAVFCAGDKSQQILKVDILSFREATLQFDDKITKRIDFNKNCKANSGLQKNPCCIPQGLYCRLMPCGTCYGMTEAAPVCSTDYVNPTDRRRVRPMFLPVHPALRVVGAVQSLQNLSLTNLNSLTGGVMNVAQAQALLSSTLGVLNALPIDLPFAQALPMLNNLQGLIQNLPANMSPQAMLNIVGSQTNLLSQLPGNLNMNQIQGLLGGQVSMMDALGVAGSAANLPMGSIMSAMRSPQALLGALPVNTPLGDARQLLQLSGTSLEGLAQQGLTVGATRLRIADELRIINGLSPDMRLGDAAAAGIRLTSVNLPGSLNIGQVRSILNAQEAGLMGFGPSVPVSQYARLINSQTGVLSSLSQNLPTGTVNAMLNSTERLVNGMGNPLAPLERNALGQASQMLNGQLRGLTGLPVNISPRELNALLSGQQGLIGALKSGLNPAQLQGILKGQLGQLTQLANSLGNIPGNLGKIMTSGQVAGLLQGQLGALSGLPGLSSLSSVAGQIDGVMGLANGLGGMGSLAGGVGNIGSSPAGTLPTPVVAAMIPAMGPNPRQAKCNPNEFGEANRVPMAQLCRDLRAPFTPLNKLKMRYHNPDEPDTMVMTEGVPEGYTFKEYFGNNMPYPRLWDTGRSIQRTQSDQQDPRDDSGQYTAIVGVGHEGAPGSGAGGGSGANREGKAQQLSDKDQRCLYGGWGENVSAGGVTIQLPDPIASWTELKLYQARTLRDTRLSCLGRYDKTYKAGSSENMVLQALGAAPSTAIVTRRNGNSTTYKTISEMREAGEEVGPTDILQTRQESYPLAWRGYMSSTDEAHRFPNFPDGPPELITGLDNAQPGDIVIMENGASGNETKRGLGRIGIVTRNIQRGEYIEVTESDNGKWPDVCGTTDTWGEMKNRMMYKEGKLPQAAADEYRRIGASGDCADTHLSKCVAKNWSTLKLYRVREERREGSSETPKIPTPVPAKMNHTSNAANPTVGPPGP